MVPFRSTITTSDGCLKRNSFLGGKASCSPAAAEISAVLFVVAGERVGNLLIFVELGGPNLRRVVALDGKSLDVPKASSTGFQLSTLGTIEELQ